MPKLPRWTAFLMAVCVIAITVGARAQTAPTPSRADAMPPQDIAAREPRECVLPEQPPYQGRSLWNANLWPGGVVPYRFDANTTAGNQLAMRQAMDTLEATASVHFVARTNQGNYIHIQDSSGNNSYVGQIGGGQIVNIHNWDYRFIMCHELMHALGVWHEQSRSDRANYITVNFANIQPQYAGNYGIASGAAPQGTYDFDSIMHYGTCAFSTCCALGFDCVCAPNCATMSALPEYAEFQGLMGQRTHLSTGDMTGLVSRYGVPPCPVFSQQPAAQSAIVGQTVSMSVTAMGDGAIAYRWRHSGIALADDGRISGSGTETLTISNVTFADAGNYDCVATTTCGSATSRSAAVIVTYPSNWTQLASIGPTPRDTHAMVFDSTRGITVLFGGRNGTVNLGDTWEWNGVAWSRRIISSPSARNAHAMAYDSARGVTVLFGGLASGSTNNGETWEWNGTAWTQRVVSGPAPRNGHAMAYDSARGVTVLFGGTVVPNTANGETWEWNGTAWTQRLVAGPSPRRNFAMAYDSARGVTVLFGGLGSDTNGESWEWNGTAWTQRTVSGPAPRYAHSMAFDPARGVTTLFGGGLAVNGINSETWEWNGATWTQRNVSGPAARRLHAMTYDTARGAVVLFGGIDTIDLRDTWGLAAPCSAVSIISHPAARTACLNGPASFGVSAQGSGTISYQWRHGSPPAAIPGATSATYDIAHVSAADSGPYDCIVTNLCGSVISNPATLSVCPGDFNCDAFVNSQDFFDFLAAFFMLAPSADFNQDTFINSQDFFDFLGAFFAGC